MSKNASKQSEGSSKLIISIHGIRTHAEWNTQISHLFRTKTKHDYWIANYWPFDALDMFLPLPFWKKRKQKILELILKAKDAKKDISIIAHSFGTYIIIQILHDNPHITIDRLILCGSVVKSEALTTAIERQIREEIINDCGVRDFWPALAEFLSFAYQATGVRGFGGRVRDRYFPFGHSGFFEPGFAERFWIPLFQGAQLQSSLLQGGLTTRQYGRPIRALMWLASLRVKIAVSAILLSLIFFVSNVFFDKCWLSTCEIKIDVNRTASFAEAACFNGERLYSNLIQDDLNFNRFIRTYEARWYFEKGADGRPLSRPPVLSDLQQLGAPIVQLDKSHADRP